jgi:hypothetical protein
VGSNVAELLRMPASPVPAVDSSALAAELRATTARDDEALAPRRPRARLVIGLVLAICAAAAWLLTRSVERDPADRRAMSRSEPAVPASAPAGSGSATASVMAIDNLATSATDAGVAVAPGPHTGDARGAVRTDPSVQAPAHDSTGPGHGPHRAHRPASHAQPPGGATAPSPGEQGALHPAQPAPVDAAATDRRSTNPLRAMYQQGDFANVVRTCSARIISDDDAIELCLIAACYEHDIEQVERWRPIITRRPQLIESCKQAGNIDPETWRD